LPCAAVFVGTDEFAASGAAGRFVESDDVVHEDEAKIWPMSQTISSAFQWWADNTPGNTAVLVDDDRLSYLELHDWANRVAVDLAAAGVQPGDRVAICAGNSIEFCVAMLATMRAAAIVAPISTRLTAYEIGEILDDLAPAIVFADEANLPKFATEGARALGLAEVQRRRHGERIAPAVELDPDAPVGIMMTSGSTARPKGAVFTHRAMTAAAAEFAVHVPHCFGPGTRTVTFPALSTSAGFSQFVTYSVLGCTLYIESGFDAQRCLDLLVGERINVCAGAPIFFERMATCPGFESADLSNVRLATAGGATVTRALLDQWRRKGVVIRQMYGQTECGGYATLISEKDAIESPEKCGRGGIFSDVRIVGDDGRPAAPGQAGEIVLRGPANMVGYWNNPQATAQVLRNGWIHTGDIGVIDEQGLLTFVDRKKDIIISGGLNISAAEVERAILDFAGIDEAVVIAAPDARFGETPLAIIHAAQPIQVEALIAHCNARLADFKVPRYVVQSAEPLPRLATGKLSKAEVRKRYAHAHETLTRVR
jgi:fatty-acyl-CoA synthase